MKIYVLCIVQFVFFSDACAKNEKIDSAFFFNRYGDYLITSVHTPKSSSHGNCLIKIYKKIKNTYNAVYIEHLFCSSFLIDSFDVGDGNKSLLLFHENGGRSNPTYYLFTFDEDCVTRMRGFENLPNPNIDFGIITTVALYGDKYKYKFYRMQNKKLIDLHHSITINMNDSTTYSKIINKITTIRNFFV